MSSSSRSVVVNVPAFVDTAGLFDIRQIAVPVSLHSYRASVQAV